MSNDEQTPVENQTLSATEAPSTSDAVTPAPTDAATLSESASVDSSSESSSEAASETPLETPFVEAAAVENAVPATWDSLGLDPRILELITQAGYTKPSPVQEKSIPLALEGKDLIVSAQTGTGKTAAFVLPLVEKLKGREGTYGLILAPSREVALQI
ncbi:MAG: DEAD/DEAH box helicase, partial [Proteobacteria bacterium]